jgi:serine/threonine protein kinase
MRLIDNVLQNNVLVDQKGHPQLCDFGLAIVGSTTVGNMTPANIGAGSVRFMSPERFNSEDSKRNTSDDVYAFGCLIYTVTLRPRFLAMFAY